MYYFASDMHLGSGTPEECRARELAVVEWLDKIAPTAKGIFLVGDVFDFWFEYKRVVPKGFTRLLGKLSELTDKGVEIHFFAGNHDMWQRDYLEKECGLRVHLGGEILNLGGKKVYICHGDDIYARHLGGWTSVMNATFRSRVTRWLFSHLIHPDFALRLGQGWSYDSRKSKSIALPFLGKEDPLIMEAERVNSSDRVDYFVFGHIHCAERHKLAAGGEAIFLGHWFEGPTYATLDHEGQMRLYTPSETK